MTRLLIITALLLALAAPASAQTVYDFDNGTFYSFTPGLRGGGTFLQLGPSSRSWSAPLYQAPLQQPYLDLDFLLFGLWLNQLQSSAPAPAETSMPPVPPAGTFSNAGQCAHPITPITSSPRHHPPAVCP